MKYKITHTTNYKYSEAVPVCHNQVHLAPRNLATQRCVEHRLLVRPSPSDITTRKDYFGNRVDFFSILEAHQGLTVTATSKVEMTPKQPLDGEDSPAWNAVVNELHNTSLAETFDAYQYVFNSPYVQRSAILADYARQSLTDNRPILEAVLELTSRLHGDFKYDPKATNINTPLHQVFEKRRGVCQDFAHVQIGCLRSLGLAARYVSGYLRTNPAPGRPRLVGVDASHAWLAVYCGPLGWIDFDPTNNVIPSTDHISVAWGRDYGDVCPIQGLFIGGGQHNMSVSVDVAAVDET